LEGRDHEVTVVAGGDIPPLFELQDGIVGHFLAVCCTVCLGPSELTWILLGFEELVALGGAEVEELGVVPSEGNTMARIYTLRTEITLANSHWTNYII